MSTSSEKMSLRFCKDWSLELRFRDDLAESRSPATFSRSFAAMIGAIGAIETLGFGDL